MIEFKKCKECGEILPLSEFYHKGRKDINKRDQRCKPCFIATKRLGKELRKSAPEEPERCECCGLKTSETSLRRLCIDHDHKTKLFRGWLCDNCNTALGLLGDSLV